MHLDFFEISFLHTKLHLDFLMRSVYAYSPWDDSAYARISFLEQRQTYLDNECMQQTELVERLESKINSLEENLVKKTEKNHELEDSLVVFSEDIKNVYKENTTLAVEIHKIHKFLYSFTKRVEVRFQLIESTIEEITCKMQNLSLK